MIELVQPKKTNGFRSAAYKSLMELLDLDACENTPSFRKSGIQLFHKIILISPNNFPRISYLDLESAQYSYRIPHLRYGQYLWQLKEQIIQRHMELISTQRIFEIFESEMITKMKNKQYLSYYMRKYLNYCKITKRCSNELDARRIYLTLAYLLIASKNQDSNLVSEFLQTVFVTQNLKDFFLFESTCETSYMCYLIELARTCRFDMWGLLSETPHFKTFPICPVLGCLLTGHYCRMQALLKFGFQKLPSRSSINIYRSGVCNPLYGRYGVIQVLRQAGVKIKLPETRLDTSTIHRMFLAIEVMYVLCKTISSSNTHKWKWVKCHEYLWRTIPDAYLSPEEMNKIMQSLSYGNSDSIINLCNIYKNTFPEAMQVDKNPRALKHLCRCAIRLSLRQNYVLPQGLDLLPVPRILKAFLNLEA